VATEFILFIVLILTAYLLGSVPLAYLVVKWSRGIDLRRYGSGNVGASNVVAVASKQLAIPVIVFDLGKGAMMVWVAQWVAQSVGLGIAQQVTVGIAAGIAAIIGHNWSVFLGFSGGRGALTLAGVALILAPVLAVILLFVVFLCALFRQLSLGAVLAIASLPIFSWFLDEPFGIEEPLPVTLGFLAMFLVTVIRRLTAPQTSVTASVPPGQLVVNRLLFDRDIRDREAWIHRLPPEVSLSKQQEKQEKG